MNMTDYGEEPHPFSNALDAYNTLATISHVKGISVWGGINVATPIPAMTLKRNWQTDFNELRMETAHLIDDIKNHLAGNGSETHQETDISGGIFVNQFATSHLEENKYFVPFKGRTVVYWSWKTLCDKIGDDPLNYVIRYFHSSEDKRRFATRNDWRLFHALWKMLELMKYTISQEEMSTTWDYTFTEKKHYARYQPSRSLTLYSDGNGGEGTIADDNVLQIYSSSARENLSNSESSIPIHSTYTIQLDDWNTAAGTNYSETLYTKVCSKTRLQRNGVFRLRKEIPMEDFTLHGQITHRLIEQGTTIRSSTEEKDIMFQNGEGSLSRTCSYSQPEPSTIYSTEKIQRRQGQADFDWNTGEKDKLQRKVYRFCRAGNIS